MNTPNKLTLLRMILVPVFLVILLSAPYPYNNIIAVLIFIVASITDAVDGHLARKNNLITDFGKFMDPLADKLLVSSALIGLLSLSRINAYVVAIIIFREFAVTSMRLIAAGNNKVIAAGFWGKIKTIIQMVAIILLLIEPWTIGSWEFNTFNFFVGSSYQNTAFFGTILIYIATALTIFSGVEYFVINKDVINYKK